MSAACISGKVARDYRHFSMSDDFACDLKPDAIGVGRRRICSAFPLPALRRTLRLWVQAAR